MNAIIDMLVIEEHPILQTQLGQVLWFPAFQSFTIQGFLPIYIFRCIVIAQRWWEEVGSGERMTPFLRTPIYTSTVWANPWKGQFTIQYVHLSSRLCKLIHISWFQQLEYNLLNKHNLARLTFIFSMFANIFSSLSESKVCLGFRHGWPDLRLSMDLSRISFCISRMVFSTVFLKCVSQMYLQFCVSRLAWPQPPRGPTPLFVPSGEKTAHDLIILLFTSFSPSSSSSSSSSPSHRHHHYDFLE